MGQAARARLTSAGSWADTPTGEVSPQANRACPALAMLIDATSSACPACPHETHRNTAWLGQFAAETCPHSGQVRLVFGAGTASSQPPRQTCL